MSERTAVPAYISAIAYSLGTATPLADLNDPGLAPELANLLREGVTTCRVAKEGARKLAASAVQQSFEISARQLPDGVVYCSDTITGTPTRDVRELLSDVGCTASPVIMAGGNACGNLGAGLEVATGWLSTQRVSSVLLVTSDEAAIGTRYLASGLTALSDGAASCVVSRVPHGPGYRVLAIASGGTGLKDEDGRSSTLRHVAAGIERSVRTATDIAGVEVSDFRYSLTGNLGRMMRAFLTMAAGLPLNRVYAPDVETVGHCFAADILIDLQTLVVRKLVDPGDKIMLLPTSPESWCVIALEYVL
jgi:3-oxoacyl-[acyl-carrier-protein] synthase-3